GNGAAAVDDGQVMRPEVVSDAGHGGVHDVASRAIDHAQPGAVTAQAPQLGGDTGPQLERERVDHRATAKRATSGNPVTSVRSMLSATSSGLRSEAGSASGTAARCMAVSISPGSTATKRTPLPAVSALQ